MNHITFRGFLIAVPISLLFAVEPASAQITPGEALESAKVAVTRQVEAAVKKVELSVFIGLRVGSHLVQVGRVLANYGQLTAMERAACAGKIKDFNKLAVEAFGDANAGNLKFQEARFNFIDGVLLLAGGDPNNANNKFLTSQTRFSQGTVKWNDAALKSIQMTEKTDELKTIIDNALND